MDLAAERARRKNRSSTNINHLTLAPLTTKLPLSDGDVAALSDPNLTVRPISYIQGKSAPTTPRLLTRSPAGPRSRSHHRTPSAPGAPVAKSKSTTHLAGQNNHNRRSLPGHATPRRGTRDDGLAPRDRDDSDWVWRTGAVMTFEARESKGQSWLVSMQSSTSLAGMRDADDEALDEELAYEREVASRRGSSALADDDASPYGSRFHSRANSRSHSLTGLRSHLLTPYDRVDTAANDSYFPQETSISGPDFVNLDEKLEELEADTVQDDEAAIRRLVRRGQQGSGSWIQNVIGWSLFDVAERDEDSDDEESLSYDDTVSQSGRSAASHRQFEGILSLSEDKMPPPKKDEGGWNDAAWLLSVATKVIF